MAKTAEVEFRFKSPGPQPNGLQAEEDGLWYIDQGDNRLFKLDYDSGDTLFEAQTTTDRSSGITLGGGSLWIASTYNRKVARLDPETGVTLEERPSPGAGINSTREGFPNPAETGDHGLEWKDGYLYVASPPSQHVHVMEPDEWKEVHRFKTPGFRVHGIAWAREKGMMWLADTAMGVVSKVRVADGRVYDMFRVLDPVEVHGLTMHQDTLWYADAHNRDVGRLNVDMTPAF